MLLAFVFMASGICLLYPRLPVHAFAFITRTNDSSHRRQQRSGEWPLMARILGAMLIAFGVFIGWTG